MDQRDEPPFEQEVDHSLVNYGCDEGLEKKKPNTVFEGGFCFLESLNVGSKRFILAGGGGNDRRFMHEKEFICETNL